MTSNALKQTRYPRYNKEQVAHRQKIDAVLRQRQLSTAPSRQVRRRLERQVA